MLVLSYLLFAWSIDPTVFWLATLKLAGAIPLTARILRVILCQVSSLIFKGLEVEGCLRAEVLGWDVVREVLKLSSKIQVCYVIDVAVVDYLWVLWSVEQAAFVVNYGNTMKASDARFLVANVGILLQII